MKISLYSLWAVFLLAAPLQAQQWVSTQVETKHVILEEFTGVRCGSCPEAHRIVSDLENAHPGKVWIVGLHPVDDWHTVPLSPSDPDLRHNFANSFFNQGYFDGTIYMPSGMVNRRKWTSNSRAYGRYRWTAQADTILGETSPVNIGLQARYDSLIQEVKVDLEVYFTDKVDHALNIYVVLLEDSIIAGQAGEGSQYMHFNVLRSSMTGAFGKSLTDSANAGTLKTLSLSTRNFSPGTRIDHLRALAYVRDRSNGEILSGKGVRAEAMMQTSVERLKSSFSFEVYPNPVKDMASIRIETEYPERISYELYDLSGRLLQKIELGNFGAGIHVLPFRLDQSPGLYLLSLHAGNKSAVQKVWLE